MVVPGFAVNARYRPSGESAIPSNEPTVVLGGIETLKRTTFAAGADCPDCRHARPAAKTIARPAISHGVKLRKRGTRTPETTAGAGTGLARYRSIATRASPMSRRRVFTSRSRQRFSNTWMGGGTFLGRLPESIGLVST